MTFALAVLVAATLTEVTATEAPRRPFAVEFGVGVGGGGMVGASASNTTSLPFGGGPSLGAAVTTETLRPVTLFLRADLGVYLGTACFITCGALSADVGARFNFTPQFFLELGGGGTTFAWSTGIGMGAGTGRTGPSGELGLGYRTGPALMEAWTLRVRGGLLDGPMGGQSAYALMAHLSYGWSAPGPN